MDEFLTAAVVGIAHYRNALPISQSEIDTLTKQITAGQKERAFLLAAGARAIYQQAGKRALEATEPPIPAPSETLSACSGQVAHLITDLFTASNSILLPEALQRLQSAHLRVPYEILPICLMYVTQQKEHRAELISVLGERGPWLSQFNADWNWISDELTAKNNTLPADAETIWQEGRLEQRRAVLQRLRAQDPEKARAWLQAVWQDEKAETRIAFLSCLQENLSGADQAFIEQALEDRSEGVRQMAVSLLHFMPESPQLQYMIATIDQMLDYKKVLLQQQFIVTLPQAVTLEWKSAIAISKLKQDNHDAEYWLHLGLSRISPQHWEERFSSTPEKLVQALKNALPDHSLLPDIMQAAIFHETVSWYTPLLEWYINSEPEKDLKEICHQMFQALPVTTRETLIAPLQTNREQWEKAIQLLPAPWSISFSRSCLTMLKEYAALEDTVGHSTFWPQIISNIVPSLHPSCFEQLQEFNDLPKPKHISWQLQQKHRSIAEFIGLIQLRTRILEEI